MNSDTPKYYQPYDSGEDTDDGSDIDSEDYDSEDLPDFEDSRIRREEDPRYALIRSAGPNFNTSAEQLKYMEHAPGAIYDNSTNITSLSNFTYLNPPKTTKTSLFSIKSLNRDNNVWKTPFQFQLKTPRVYKNVTKLQLVQISFPNNTTNFVNSPTFTLELENILLKGGVPEDCLSTCVALSGCKGYGNSIAVAEMGRLNLNNQPTYTVLHIPNGQYTNQDLAKAFTESANNTPPFSPISYDTFKNEFKIHRDISILFNEPGEIFRNNFTNLSGHHTKQDIIHSYYTTYHFDSFPIITDKIAFNAYYFPVLKELVSSEYGKIFTKKGSYTWEQIVNYVLGHFLGLDSDIYFDLCSINQGTLDNFRRLHTFELRNINKYVFSYDEHSRRFSVKHDCLHPSIQKDITQKYNSLYNNILTIKNLTSRSFQTIKTQYSHANSIFQELQSFLSTQLNICFGVDNYTYNGGLLHSGYTVDNLHTDPMGFTDIFNINQTFGEQIYGNYHGTNLTFTNFLDYHSTISSYYNTVSNTSSIISSVYGYTNFKLHQYVSTKYDGILPYSLIHNSTYMECKGVPAAFFSEPVINTPGSAIKHPYLSFQSLSALPQSITTSLTTTPEASCIQYCCLAFENLVRNWYSCIPVNTVINAFPNYRLGIPSFDFYSFNALSSVFNITSTSNFNLFLQLNTFQDMNNMDIAMTENYDISNETTGQVNLMAAKILLQGVGTGELSETAIQNPILFDTPLGKLDRLNINLYFDDGPLTPAWKWLPFELGINEWDATFQIDEEVALADRNAGFSGNIPTVPIPNNPGAFQYMALTSTNNPLNK